MLFQEKPLWRIMGRPKKTQRERNADKQVKQDLRIDTLYPKVSDSLKGNSNASVLKALNPSDFTNPAERLIPRLNHLCKQMDCSLNELVDLIINYLENEYHA
jgi:hypothetical protein